MRGKDLVTITASAKAISRSFDFCYKFAVDSVVRKLAPRSPCPFSPLRCVLVLVLVVVRNVVDAFLTGSLLHLWAARSRPWSSFQRHSLHVPGRTAGFCFLSLDNRYFIRDIFSNHPKCFSYPHSFPSPYWHPPLLVFPSSARQATRLPVHRTPQVQRRIYSFLVRLESHAISSSHPDDCS